MPFARDTSARTHARTRAHASLARRRPPNTNTQVGGTVPDGRINHTMCTLDHFLYVYGGSFKTAAFSDVHRLDTGGAAATITPRRTPPPHPPPHPPPRGSGPRPAE